MVVKVLAVLLASIGAVLSIKSFENSFNNSHQRIGLALYGAIWVQALAGFRRPKRGTKGRTVWYFFHWILGTTISLVGIFNIYTGLKAYQKRTSRSITLWTILFTSEVSFMGLFYLFQDKWEYIQKQGVILDIAPNTDSDQVLPQRENHKEVLTEPCAKRNALENLNGIHQRNRGWVQMGECTIAMMDWHHIRMNPYTHLATLAEEQNFNERAFTIGIGGPVGTGFWPINLSSI
ncbi:unnamed protein product [Ilex paraguariensis]|uniref:Cytochrome b561 domain-containing protein n=1 Tax=Ilex paraguariensis TaxID=185542 RepID=A0ABC8QUE9_9AQUA